MDILKKSWANISDDAARKYLKEYGHPSEESRHMLARILEREFKGRRFSIIDLGCGNAQLLECFKEHELDCEYTGVDFSQPLLDAASEAHADAHFLQSDVNFLTEVSGSWDVAVYSHVVEILGSPDASLKRARELADKIIIRFFEPPEFEHDLVEVRQLKMQADGESMPYIRRKMSRDYYRLILAQLGCRTVDVYNTRTSRDQIHILNY